MWLVAAAGCASVSSKVETGVDLKSYKNYYIIDNNNIDVITGVKRALATRGINATSGPGPEAPPSADCKMIVESLSHSMDFRQLDSLTIVLSDAKTGLSLATASMPENPEHLAAGDMTRKVVDALFEEKKKK